MDQKQKKIGVLMGGYSSEREISLKSGQAVYQALKDQGFDVISIDIVEKDLGDILQQISNVEIDVAFIALHGILGEDGQIQGILESLNIPYTGSSVEASRLALNKVETYNLLRKNKLPILPSVILTQENFIFENIKSLGQGPWVVKPASGGSSIGIVLVESVEKFDVAIQEAFKGDSQVIIEPYLKAREFTVGILEDTPLAAIEICPENLFFDFQAKYEKGKTKYVVPANLPQDISRYLQELALDVHRLIGCVDFSRVDFLLDENMNPYILELNTIPGFTETSLLPMAAEHNGINFKQLCRKLVELAYGKKKEIQNLSVSS
jgi:D-alanine-D-alanine ligase